MYVFHSLEQRVLPSMSKVTQTLNYYYYYTSYQPLFQDNLGEPVRER